MNNNLTFNFQPANIFFVNLFFERPSALSGPHQLELAIEVKVVTDNYPNRLQLNLRLKSADDSPIKFSIEVVGLFDYVGDEPEKGRSEIFDFIRLRGVYMVWASISQMVHMITSQMGMNPLTLNTPLEFNLEKLSTTLLSEEAK